PLRARPAPRAGRRRPTSKTPFATAAERGLRRGRHTLARSALAVAERDEPAPLLVPQRQARGRDAVEDPQVNDTLEQLVLLVARLQVVVGYPGAQVMDVVEPDVAGDPLQHLGELVVRAALHRRERVVPLRGVLPVRPL